MIHSQESVLTLAMIVQTSYGCRKCGYVEHYLDQPDELEKIGYRAGKKSGYDDTPWD